MTVPSVFQPNEASQKANPVPRARLRNCAAGIRLPCGVAERITPCHLDLGERAVGEPAQQFALGC